MSQLLRALGRSVGLKLAMIGFLVLVLLLPTAMIEGVVRERAALEHEARGNIMQAFGHAQTLSGPILRIPYRQPKIAANGKRFEKTGAIYHLPRNATFKTNVDTQERYRGLYTIPVFETSVAIEAQFDPVALSELNLDDATIEFDRAQLVIGLSDPRTLRSTPIATVNNLDLTFGPGKRLHADIGPTIDVALRDTGFTDATKTLSVITQLEFAGTDRLQFLPVGDTQSVFMNANWPDPSFAGHYLPSTRNISDAGFDAQWHVTSLGRLYPGTWVDDDVTAPNLHQSAFGTHFKPALNTYDRARRAVHYAVLAIVLTFACFFLFDVLNALRLHPFQYLLVGFANCLFFLLLLSLAEHIGFALAYAISAIASIGLIGGYSVTVLGAAKRALLCCAVLAALYGFVYMTLRAQSYALLAGSLGLWCVLAAVMYLTRRVDWRAAAAQEMV
ncbi:MAG: cell envelope integrity protein CreD [Gammaproteobacteria bacterium]